MKTWKEIRDFWKFKGERLFKVECKDSQGWGQEKEDELGLSFRWKLRIQLNMIFVVAS